MDEQGKEEPSENQENRIKKILRKVFTYIAKSVGTLAILIGILGGCIKVYEFFFAEPVIKYNFSKYKFTKVVAFSGELINDSSEHAKGLTFKGKFSSKIIDLEVTTNDSIEKYEINNPTGSVEFFLNRLSKKSKCAFNIFVNQESEITEQVQVSWGEKGMLVLIAQGSDEKVIKGIKLREKISGLDLSRKARHKWFEDNAKNIR